MDETHTYWYNWHKESATLPLLWGFFLLTPCQPFAYIPSLPFCSSSDNSEWHIYHDLYLKNKKLIPKKLTTPKTSFPRVITKVKYFVPHLRSKKNISFLFKNCHKNLLSSLQYKKLITYNRYGRLEQHAYLLGDKTRTHSCQQYLSQ